MVARDAQGCDKLTVKPYLSHATDSFACTWKTCKGAVRVEWKRADGAVTVAVEVPEGVETAIESPWGSEVLSSKTEACVPSWSFLKRKGLLDELSASVFSHQAGRHACAEPHRRKPHERALR